MAPSLAGFRIIVVEPHDDMRELLDQFLRLLGASVCPVATARDAADRMSEADIILTDVAMPGEDGVWLWEQVNSQFPHLPVVALTGYTAEQYPRITQAKFARTLLKPVDPEEVARAVWELLRGASPASTTAA
jgi:CheY-like chemotaxis protein